MSGHSKWAKIHRKKGVADAKKGAVFTKIGNIITIAAKSGGGDLESNFQLRLAIEKAKAVNMPKENIDRAVKRGTGELADKNSLEEATYEIFGPAGSVFLVDTITDNKNRVLSEIKNIINKGGGHMGSSNSVSWMFEKKGVIVIDKTALGDKNPDELELNLIDAGAIDIFKGEEDWEIYTAAEELQKVVLNLKNLGLVIKESNQASLPKDELNITDSGAREKIENLFGALDELEDVNNIYTNATW